MTQEKKMDEIKISLDATGNKGEISVVRVDGVIDTMTASELEKVMNRLTDQEKYNIIIDLGGVDYISSAGWGIFISNIRDIRQHQGDLKLAGMVPNVYEIYELLEFDTILKAFENVDRARTDFSQLGGVGEQVKPENDQTRPFTTEELNADDYDRTEPDIRPPASKKPEVVEEEPEKEKVMDIDADERRVLKLASDDPFLSTWSMRKILNSEPGNHPKLGWFKIRRILKKHDILSKRKRFQFARKR